MVYVYQYLGGRKLYFSQISTLSPRHLTIYIVSVTLNSYPESFSLNCPESLLAQNNT